jgi:hypothetical protein
MEEDEEGEKVAETFLWSFFTENKLRRFID